MTVDAGVAELVDAHDSKSCSARSVGSIPSTGTNFFRRGLRTARNAGSPKTAGFVSTNSITLAARAAMRVIVERAGETQRDADRLLLSGVIGRRSTHAIPFSSLSYYVKIPVLQV